MKINWNVNDVTGKIPQAVRDLIQGAIDEIEQPAFGPTYHREFLITRMASVYLSGYNDGLEFCTKELRRQRVEGK